MKLKTAIILAGGFGTRLQEVVSDVPKPMAPVAGRPFLEYLLDYLRHFDFEEVMLSVGYKADVITKHFGTAYKGMKLVYAVEHTPLGTGGAILYSFSKTQNTQALILNGDSFLDVDLSEVYTHLAQSQAEGAIVLREMPRPDRFGTVECDSNGMIQSFREKQQGLALGLINAGIYILDRSTFSRFGLEGKFSVEEDLFKPHVHRMHLLGFVSHGYFIDIGIPEEYERAQQDFLHFRYGG